MERPEPINNLSTFAPTYGLLYAALISLKSTYVIFPAVQITITIFTLLALKTDYRKLAKFTFQVFLYTMVFVGPWLTPILTHSAQDISQSFLTTGPTPPIAVNNSHDSLNIFSADGLFWGGSFLSYTILSACALVPIALSVFPKRLIPYQFFFSKEYKAGSLLTL